jgi:hypothetical protein
MNLVINVFNRDDFNHFLKYADGHNEYRQEKKTLYDLFRSMITIVVEPQTNKKLNVRNEKFGCAGFKVSKTIESEDKRCTLCVVLLLSKRPQPYMVDVGLFNRIQLILNVCLLPQLN